MDYRSKHLDRALEALAAQKLNKAEREFKKAVRDLDRHSNRLDMFFALGQQGYMYEQMGEKEKAVEAYRQAVDAGTDIPATYTALISLLVEMGEFDEAFHTGDIWQEQGAQHIGRPAHTIFLDLGSSRIHSKDFTTAIELLGRSRDFFDVSNHAEEHWRALGLLGFAFEKAGDTENAMEVFSNAVDAGSQDRQTFTRLIMFLEKDKQYKRALKVIDQGKKVQNDAAWEADLKKRRQRISRKAGLISKEEAASDIPQFTVRKGKKQISLQKQVKCSPQIASVAFAKSRAYGLSGGKKPRVRAWDLDSGEQVMEVELPEGASQLELTEIGFITVTERGRVGEGSSTIRFHDAHGNIIETQEISDKLSEIAVTTNRAFVGCRDGRLYAYSSHGEKLWHFGLKQSKSDSEYMRPCPYYVRARGDMVVFSSFSDLYAIGEKGKLLWKWSTPTHSRSSKSEYFEITLSSGPASIAGLALADDDMRAVVTAGGRIYQILGGKTKSTKKKEGYLGSVFAGQGNQFAIHDGERFVLYEDSRSVGSILAPEASTLNYGRLNVAWGRKELVVSSVGGKDLARIEFARTISGVSNLVDNRVAVAAGHLIILNIDSDRIDRTPISKVEPKPGASRISKESKPERSEEEGIRVRWISGNKLPARSGKAKYRAKDGAELTIEQLVLRHFSDLGCEGLWSENEYWWAVMALLFWDDIYAKLPGVYSDLFGDFPNQMQDMPTDLFSEEFYARRKGLIENRLRALKSDNPDEIPGRFVSSEIRSAYRSHYGKPCRILDWNRYSQVSQLEFATSILSPRQVSAIMSRLLSDFNNNRRGMPDLFLSCRGSPLFIEVKSERESVKNEQFNWLRFLHDEVGIQSEVCRVRAK